MWPLPTHPLQRLQPPPPQAFGSSDFGRVLPAHSSLTRTGGSPGFPARCATPALPNLIPKSAYLARETLLLVVGKAKWWSCWWPAGTGTPRPPGAAPCGWQRPAGSAPADTWGRWSSRDQSWSPSAKHSFCSFWVCLSSVFLWFWNRCERKAVLVA